MLRLLRECARPCLFLLAAILWQPAYAQSAVVADLVQQAEAQILQQRYSEALLLLEQAYNLARDPARSQDARSVLNTLANLHYNTDRLDQAERYYRELAELDRASGDTAALAVSLYNLGHAAASQQRDSEADGYFRESLQLSQQDADISGQAYAWKALGVNALARGETGPAQDYLAQADSAFADIGDTRQRASVQRHLGDLALAGGAAEAAVHSYLAAIPVLAATNASTALQRSYRGLSLAYEMLGNHEEALKAQRLYTELLQEGLQEQSRDLTQRMQAELDTRRYVDDNARLQVIQQEQEQALDQSRQVLRLQYLVLALAAAVLALALLLLWRSRKMTRRLHVLASTDVLTGLLNRRAIIDNGTRLWQRTLREDLPFTVLLLDVDHFKSVNDTFGHAAGDAVLCALADSLRSSFRITDAIGRIGGEEFLLLAAGVDTGEATQLAERIRQRVAQTRIAGISDRTLSCSIGIASRTHEQSLEQLIQHADQSLYRAKQEGRDRVEIYAPPSLSATTPAYF